MTNPSDPNLYPTQPAPADPSLVDPSPAPADQPADTTDTTTGSSTSAPKVGDVVHVDAQDPVTGAPLTGPAVVTAVHDDDEGGFSVAPLPSFGFRITIEQLTA